ncbi:RNA polymerase sigma factor [Sporosarcina sp. CAU 1771]
MIKELLYKFSKKDSDSERVIFEMFYQRVYYTAYYIIKDRDLAQDVLQETFIKAFDNMHTVRDGEKLGAWLAAIATRTAIDYLRKLKRWNDIATEDEIIGDIISKNDDALTTLETIVEEKFIGRILLQEIDGLSAEHKEVLLLYYYADMKYEEISNALEIKIDTIKTRIYRAKLKLKESFEKKPEIMGLIIDVKV